MYEPPRPGIGRRQLLALAGGGLAATALAPALAARSQQALELVGRATVSGAPASCRLLLRNHAPHWYAEHRGISALRSGGDGTQLWRTVDGTGPIHIELAERELWTLLHWVLSGYWLHPSAPLERSADGRQLRLHDGRFLFAIEGDPERPGALRTVNTPSPVLLHFDGTLPYPGRWLPRRIRIEGAGELSELLLLEAAPVADVAPEQYLAPPAQQEGFHFLPGADAELEVRRADTGHLFVRPHVQGEQPGWFLFDSGAGITLLAQELIERYQLPQVGRTRVMGIGGSAGEKGIHRCDSLRIGPMQFDGAKAVSYDPAKSRASTILGAPVWGVLGWDVLLRSALELDMRDGRLWLHPSGSVPVPRQHRQALFLHWKVPWVEAECTPGGRGLFMLDTGAGSKGLFFPNHSVRRLDLLAQLPGREGRAYGAGGSVAVRHGTLQQVTVGGRRMRDVPARLSLGEDHEGDIHTLGILGGAVLAPFRVVLDYRRGLAGFLPRDLRQQQGWT